LKGQTKTSKFGEETIWRLTDNQNSAKIKRLRNRQKAIEVIKDLGLNKGQRVSEEDFCQHMLKVCQAYQGSMLT